MEQTTLTRVVLQRAEAGGEDARAAVAISFEAEPGASVRRQWDAWVVAGGFSRRLQEAGLPAGVEVRDSGGAFVARPKVKGQADPQALSPREEAAVVSAVRAAVGQSGGRVLRLELHRPYGVALALSLAVDDPARFLKQRLRPLMEQLDAHRAKLEGIYLGVLGPDGRLAMEWGSWTRNPAGSYWVRLDLTNCSPIRQSGPPGTEPPPACPG
jgi:hypothetical protein